MMPLRRLLAAALLCSAGLAVGGCATAHRAKIEYPVMPQTKPDRAPVALPAISKPSPKLPERERLVYQVEWLGMHVGTVVASINGVKQVDGHSAYELEVVARTAGFCSSIYRIDDRYVSYMDVDTLATLRHEVYRREGRYKKDAITVFDHVRKKAHFRNLIDGSERDIDIPENVQDTLSACYYFRTLPVDVGTKVEYKVYNNESVYDLFGVVENRGRVTVPRLGSVDTFFIQPYAKLKGEEVRKGKVAGFFTADARRIPVLAVARAPLFTEVSVYLDALE